MAERTSSQLKIGEVYARDDLRERFNITDSTSNNGIFRPKGTDSVWIFVTEQKTPDRVQYIDHLDGDVLLMQGQTEGRTDALIREQATNGLELLVFHRAKKYEHEGAGFRYLGPFDFVRSFGSRPTSFVLLRDTGRSFKYGDMPTWRWTLHAVQQLGGSATKKQIADYLKQQVNGFDNSNLDPDLRLITINEYGRSAWPMNRQPRYTDGSNPYDALFRRGKGTESVYELYDPLVHAVWELAPDMHGVMRPRPFGDSVEAVEAQVAAEEDTTAFDATNETDARDRVLASIVRRRGQPKFRRELLDAYSGRCAVTGCELPALLEGAHIKPYKGEHTNHVTNGLLLRADIHTLFDLGLLRLHPETLIIYVAVAARSDYGAYHGQVLATPKSPSRRPDQVALSEHFDRSSANF
jgi:hypothetical protein